MTARTAVLLLLLVPSGGCRAITTIFQAGVWVGVIMVVLILAVAGFIAGRLRRR